MSNYLLLRDNKQSGPYTFDELKSKGLKAYDLVWVDGKSAAWRYPSEVTELKSFAPIVEEQPFDRFFKKPSQESSSSNAVIESPRAYTPAAIAEVPLEGTAAPVLAVAPATKEIFSSSASTAATESSPAPASPAVIDPTAVPSGGSSAGRRIIYVTMPGNTNKTAAVVTPTVVPVAPIREIPVRETPVRETGFSGTMRAQTGPEPDYAPNRNTGEKRLKAAAAFGGLQIPHQELIEEDFSHQSSFGDPHFVEKKSHYNRPTSTRVARPLAITLSVIALLAAGVFIGLSINGRFRSLDRASAGREEGVTDRTQDHSNTPIPVYTTAAANPGQKTGNTENLSNPVVSDPDASMNFKTNGEGSQKRKTTSSKDKTAATLSQKSATDAANSAKNSALALLAQPGREASHRTDETTDKESIKNSVVSQVSITTNKYNTGTFGGISELQLTVSNRSIYPLDLVVVEVQYVQANKKVYKTENLYFRGIGAGAALMQEAPKSSRGIKVQSRIILINSKELGLSYSGI